MTRLGKDRILTRQSTDRNFLRSASVTPGEMARDPQTIDSRNRRLSALFAIDRIRKRLARRTQGQLQPSLSHNPRASRLGRRESDEKLRNRGRKLRHRPANC